MESGAEASDDDAAKDGSTAAGPNHNPRKDFAEAVDYAVRVATVYRNILETRQIRPEGLRYLELGPGADYAPQLVLASEGAQVTLVDRYLAGWDPDYHPFFYQAFLKEWRGPDSAILAAIERGSHAGLITELSAPAEAYEGVADRSFDFVQSNAVLEHVSDMHAVARELHRVTRPGGTHTHQIDFRDHRDFTRPLEHLVLPDSEYRALRSEDRGNHGIDMRLPELVEAFMPGFWIDEVGITDRAEPDYVAGVKARLPSESRLKGWSARQLRAVGIRIVLTRKAGDFPTSSRRTLSPEAPSPATGVSAHGANNPGSLLDWARRLLRGLGRR